MDKITIGFINNFVLNEETIGYNINIKNKGENKGPVSIDVYSNEGDNIPHFHITSKNFKNGDCCVKLSVADFFKHSNHKTILSKAQMKQIDKWLRERNKDNPNITNYKACCISWNKNKSNNIKINEDNPQPNYYILGR